MNNENHKISIIIATLNSAAVLEPCLKSIRSQNYQQTNIDILICDGGSTDNTIEIAKKYKSTIYNNPLKTGEAGKAIGLKNAKGDFVALIDSDNILPSKNWLNKMLTPFSSKNIVGSEPWSYTYRPEGGYIERYSSLTGINDPYALIANNYDRKNYLRKTWNGLNIPIDDHRYYQSFELNRSSKIPSIGANGTIYRQSFIKKLNISDYLIDIDLLSNALKQMDNICFAKVKCGIIHTYCESSISKFIKKQNRRVTDLYIYKSSRPPALISSHISDTIKFTFYVIFVFPMLFDTVKGYIKKPDFAWLFHPIACVITLYIYAINTIYFTLGYLKPIDRRSWKQ